MTTLSASKPLTEQKTAQPDGTNGDETVQSLEVNKQAKAIRSQDKAVETPGWVQITEHVVEKIVEYADTVEGSLYRVRWWRFKAKYDTWERPEHIPENFIRRYHPL